MEIIPGAGWGTVFDELVATRGSAVILGTTDSGKSTMARYLVERFLAKGLKACLVDADVGQSALGLPGTICMKRFASKGDLEDYRFRRMFFVGDVNPARRISMMIEGTKKMVSACGEDPDVTLIDTSGLISGRAGEALKIGKIKAVNPGHVIALQRENELEALLGLIDSVAIYRVGVSPLAKARKPPERSAYRRQKFEDYFNVQGNSEYRLGREDVNFTYKGRICQLRSGLFPTGTVTGLNNGSETLALGLVIEVEDDALVFRSPLASPAKVKALEFGDIRIG